MTMMLLEWVVTSAFLILTVLALRWVFGRRVSARLRYALWAVVLVRLLVPVQLFNFPLAGTLVTVEKRVEHQTVDLPNDPSALAVSATALPEKGAEPGSVPAFPDAPALPAAPDPPAAPDFTKTPGWLGWVWLGGSAVMALVLAASNLRFARRLRRCRIPVEGTDCPLRVYAAVGLPSPCLFGLVRPSAYVTPETAADPAMLRHVTAHEYTHFRQGDHVWSFLRCAALVVHWWNPLVWLAVALSRRDGELACDEGALKRLGDGERAAYGNTLLALVTAKPGPGELLCFATTMAGDKKSLKERVSRIARAPKRWLWAAVVVVLVTALACTCAFGQAAEPENAPDAEPSESGGVSDPGDLLADLSFTLDENGNVSIQGTVDGLTLEEGTYWQPTGAPANTLTMRYAPFTNGIEGIIYAYWEGGSRAEVTINTSMMAAASSQFNTGYWVFTVDLGSGAVVSMEGIAPQKSPVDAGTRFYPSSISDGEAVRAARIAAKLLTAAEDYYRNLSAVDALPQTDLNRNGVPETLRVSGTSEKILLEVWENGEPIFSEEAYHAHAGYNALFLCTLDGEDYLLRYNPYMAQGWCDYSYKLFTLSEDGNEQTLQENHLEFCINIGSPIYDGSFDPEKIAAFVDEVNGLLAHSVQLINSDADLLATFQDAGQLTDDLWWLDSWEPVVTRDPSKPLLENLRDYQASMEGVVEHNYWMVLMGHSDFTLRAHNGDNEAVDERSANIADIPEILDPYDDYMKLWNFAVVDMDGDGANEVLVYGCGVSGDMSGYLLLHQMEGRVYGLLLDSAVSAKHWFGDLKTDGTFECYDPTGTAWTSITRLKFRGERYIIDDLAFASSSNHEEYDDFLVNHQEATKAEFEAVLAAQDAKPDAVWYDFTEENINVVLRS